MEEREREPLREKNRSATKQGKRNTQHISSRSTPFVNLQHPVPINSTKPDPSLASFSPIIVFTLSLELSKSLILLNQYPLWQLLHQ